MESHSLRAEHHLSSKFRNRSIQRFLSQLSPADANMFEESFRAYDSDSDGQLSPQQLRSLIAALGGTQSRPQHDFEDCHEPLFNFEDFILKICQDPLWKAMRDTKTATLKLLTKTVREKGGREECEAALAQYTAVIAEYPTLESCEEMKARANEVRDRLETVQAPTATEAIRKLRAMSNEQDSLRDRESIHTVSFTVRVLSTSDEFCLSMPSTATVADCLWDACAMARMPFDSHALQIGGTTLALGQSLDQADVMDGASMMLIETAPGQVEMLVRDVGHAIQENSEMQGQKHHAGGCKCIVS